ncbi:MAG TPA: putative cobaltochelatase [Dehalococcoidia bacterium]|nr:putative cobaltochelatase [Dehalococcoidia bacterium]
MTDPESKVHRQQSQEGRRGDAVGSRSAPRFPFTALVGQERMKKALVLNAIHPKIGGVLIRGEKGTAKSTAVRALAGLLPEVEVVAGCPFGCDPDRPDHACDDCRQRLAGGDPPLGAARQRRPIPIVELPVGATEDRVTGTLDLEAAIQRGECRFEPGLLAAANRGILYIDEVNLLNDHLVDVLLDAAAMGRNHVEREGISFSHPAELLLVGTMNPEEGDLRPQLLDRFALTVEIAGLRDPAERAQVVRRRIAFERDPAAFATEWEAAESAERDRIVRARSLLPEVRLADPLLDLITRICAEFEVDGLRADIVMYKTAVALAAYAGRRDVTPDNVREAAELALPHRRRRHPFESPEIDRQKLDDLMADFDSADPPPPEPDGDESDSGAGDGSGGDDRADPDRPYRVPPIAGPKTDQRRVDRRGRRSRAELTRSGAYVGSTLPEGPVRDLALGPTLRAAAPYQVARGGSDSPAFVLHPSDLREKVRQRRVGNLIVFVVDASGSMAAQRRMAAVKTAVLSLLLDAYQKRDQVALIAFRGRSADLLLPPTNSVDLAERLLRSLPTGGRTPLGQGLDLAARTIDRARGADRQVAPLLILVSDCRPNVPLRPGGDPLTELGELGDRLDRLQTRTILVDTEGGPVRLGFGQEIGRKLGAVYLPLADVAGAALTATVRRHLPAPGGRGTWAPPGPFSARAANDRAWVWL